MSTTTPANLFRWYSDTKKGYWAPMLQEFPKLNMGFTVDYLTKQTPIDLDAISKAAKDLVDSFFFRKRVTTIDAAATDSLLLANQTEEGALLIFAATTLASALSVGTIADAIDEVWRLPTIAAAMEQAFGAHIAEWRYGVTPMVERYWNKEYTPNIPEAYRIALGSSKGFIEDEQYYKAMAESGFNKEWANLWRDENYFFPEFGLALELLWRGVVKKEVVVDWLVKSAYKKDVAEQMMEVAVQIPPAQDLVTMVVREAFLPEMVTEAPEVFAKYMAMKGFNQDWSNRYWTMHWQPIALRQAYENVWRGYWDLDRFKFALRIADVHPDWVDDIINVMYAPPSIREMGYGLDTKAYTEDDIIRYRRWEGLSLEDATKAARALVDYRLEAEREALRREWMYLFSLGKITEDQFRANLTAVFSMNDRSELWIERGKLNTLRTAAPPTEIEYRVPTSSEALWAYKNGLRDESWLRGTLAILNWNDERINLAIERANKEIAPIPVIEVPVEYRQLTISQLQDLYSIQELTIDEIPTALVGLGYSQDIALKLTKVITTIKVAEVKFKEYTRADIQDQYELGVLTEEQVPVELMIIGYDAAHASALTLLMKVNVWYPTLKTLYSNGWITEADMYAELLNIGLSEEHAGYLMMKVIKADKPARTATEKDLTKAEIIKGAKNNILTTEQAIEMLMDIGYDRNEAIYILLINKVVAAGDPESYWDMKQVTEAYKAVLGKPAKTISPELKEMEKKVKEARDKLQALQKSFASDEAVAQAALELQTLELAYRKALILWEHTS